LSRYNCWWRGVSFSLFVRRDVVERVGHFDETLGVGTQSPWGSAEEIDYVLRALGAGFRIHYEPTIVVGHAHPVRQFDSRATVRAYRYGAGVGRVLRKHGFPAWFRIFMLLRPAAGAAISLLQARLDKARYYWAGFKGRMDGMRSQP
jgi:GT2 family glycosyltransferase